MQITREEFEVLHRRVFGTENPTTHRNVFWEEMVRTGETAYQAFQRFDPNRRRFRSATPDPVWCFERFGQTRTRLPDGRIICVAGEHEDSYNPDFCIYNDVVVFTAPDRFTIQGYPESLFPPTDFHTATRVEDNLYLLGSLGNQGRYGQTMQAFRLDTRTLSIHPLTTDGQKPPWLSHHLARYCAEHHSIHLWGGEIFTESEQDTAAGRKTVSQYTTNVQSYELFLNDLRWVHSEMPIPPNPVSTVKLPDDWKLLPSPQEIRNIADTIRRNIPPGHELFGIDLTPLATHFEHGAIAAVEDETGRYALIVVEYQGRLTLPEPLFQLFPNLDELLAVVASLE